MAEEMVVAPLSADIERVLLTGDLARLTPDQRLSYYKAVCESVGLNPLTNPFQYLNLNGKTVLYAAKACTDQLRSIHGVSVLELEESTLSDVFIVTAKVQNAKGRIDMAKGAVTLGNLKGDSLANALMKAETKAKRRATLSICGLGILDETEIETIPNAQPFDRGAYVEEKMASLQPEKPKTKAAETKQEKELEGWQKLLKACKTAADVNSQLPAAKTATDDIKMLVMATAKRLGLRFDTGAQRFVDDSEVSEADAQPTDAPESQPRAKAVPSGAISDAQNKVLQIARRENGITEADYRAVLHGVAGVEHSKEIPKQHFDAILREVTQWKENQDAEPAKLFSAGV